MRRWLASILLLACAGSSFGEVSSNPFAAFEWSEGSSALVRVDGRSVRVASGVECLYEREGMTCNGEAISGSAWDTAALPDGVQVLAAEGERVEIETINTHATVEGGRLSANVTWGSALPHVVRHWVVVPRGVTLTIEAGTVVKFVEGAGLWVEDGGALVIAQEGERVLFTALDEAVAKAYQMVFAPEATFTDNGQLQAVHCAGVSRWGSVSIGNSVTSEMYAQVNVPITVTGTRDVPLTVTWRTEDGTAVAGEDYTASSGTLTFVKNGATTQYAAVPILKDALTEETESFKVRITAAWGLNVSTAAATVTVNNFDSGADPFGGFECAEGSSEAVRIDARSTLGGQLAHGTMDLSTAGGETILLDGTPLASSTWETAAVADGLHTLTQGEASATVAVLNDASVSVEYGRLTEDVTWDKSVTHLVRNWVVIPSGKKLTITEGTVVKFTPGSGIWVEDGGTLAVTGSETELVLFTHSADDSLGAVTDVTDTVPTMNAYSIIKAPNATFTDNGWLAVMWSDVGTFGRVTLHTVRAPANAGKVYIPVTVSGTRNQAFTLRWVAADGTAKLGEDYTLASGEVTWTGTSQGTKSIVIPLIDNPENTAQRSFTVQVQVVCGMNASMTPVTVELYRNGMDAVRAGCSSAECTSAPVRVDGRLNIYGRIAHGAEAMTEAVGAVSCEGAAVGSVWETAALADGLHTLSAEEGAVEVLTLNAETLEVKGGRLEANATWSSETLYVVRHWVVIPNGMTLTVTAGTIVKFAEGAGIWVEDGGTLNVTGEAGNDVVFTHLADDTVGGDTDARPQPASIGYNKWVITKAPSCTVKDNGYWQVRYHNVSSDFAALTLHDAAAEEKQGFVWVPITVSGTRTTPFSVDWVVESNADMLAPLSGTVTWNKVADGTKYIKLPLVVDEVTEGFETFMVKLTAVRGANISDREAEVTLYDSDPVVNAAALAASYQSEANQPLSANVTVAPIKSDFQETLIVDGTVTFRYSPYWQADVSAWQKSIVRILATRIDDNKEMLLFQGEPGEEGAFTWTVRNLDDGDYFVTHHILDAEGQLVSTMGRTFHYISNVALHSGKITADEVWSANKVHLIYGDVTVAAGVIVTIEPGAVVKFCDGTGLYSEDYTASVEALGVTFTHFADDTVGGDSNLDGNLTQPLYGKYTLGGHIIVDEETKMKCKTPTQLSSLTGGSATLESGNVYFVEKNITFASGTTLTIEPGVVVKFAANTSMTIASGATLLAQGTRAAPIVFTSMKDDAHGGDTNEDGSATRPQPGDWDTIVVQGTAYLDYTQLYYAAPHNESGLIETRGSGSLTMNGCIVAHGKYDGVWNWGGTVDVRNTIIMDVGNAAAPYQGKNTYTNCVFYGNNTAVMAWSHWVGGTFKNIIVAGCGLGWANIGTNNNSLNIPAQMKFSNSVFYSPGDYALTAPNVVGQNGNMWGDPCFVDPENGDFHIQEGSIAIDMAEGSVAPETDYYGQPRMDVESAENIGTQSANGAYPDAGIHELMPRNAAADVDLVVTDIEVPEAAAVGSEVILAWTVKNLGVKPMEGMWRDTLSLVNDYGQEVDLGTIEVRGYIAPDGIKRTERTLILPPMAEGNWTLKVITNAYRDIYEGSLTANNVGLAGQKTAVSVSTLINGTSQYTVGPGGWGFYRVDPQVSGTSLSITTSATPSPVQTAFSVVPLSGTPETSQKTMYAVGATGGWFYFVNKGQESVQILVSLRRQVLLNAVSPQLIATDAREVTITLRGAGFSEGMACCLVGKQVYMPKSIVVVSASEARAHFTGLAEQNGAKLDIELTHEGQTRTLKDAITVESELSLDGLEAELHIPSAVRPGRIYEGALSYANTSSRTLPVPLFKISGESVELAHSGEEVWTQELFAVGLGGEEARGVLQPGEDGIVPFRFKVGLSGNINIAFATVMTESDVQRESLFKSYAELARALSAAITVLAPTYRVPTYNALPYLSWAMTHKAGGKDGVIAGQILLPDASPCANAEISLANIETQETITFVTDEEGYFRIEELEKGRYTLVADWLYAVEPAVWEIDGCLADVRVICTPKGRLYGVVKDDLGLPVAGATLWATFGSSITHTTTDSNGTWSLLGDFTTAGVVSVHDKGGLHLKTSLDVNSLLLTEMQSLNVVVPSAGSIRGQISVNIGATCFDGENLSFYSEANEEYTAEIKSDGTFVCMGLLPGVYRVMPPTRYDFQEDVSPIEVTAGVETQLSLTVHRSIPVEKIRRLQVKGEEYRYELAKEYHAIATSCDWDFDSDGIVDATGISVSHAYAESGKYRVTISYTLDEDSAVTWTDDDVITVGEASAFKKNVHSILEDLGWKMQGYDEGEVTIEAINGNVDKIVTGDYLLVWEHPDIVLFVTSVIQSANAFVCSVAPASFSEIVERPYSAISTMSDDGDMICSRIESPLPVQATFPVSLYMVDKKIKIMPEWKKPDNKSPIVFRGKIEISGTLELWDRGAGYDLIGDLIASLCIEVESKGKGFLGVEKQKDKQKPPYKNFLLANIIPVFVGGELSASAGVTIDTAVLSKIELSREIHLEIGKTGVDFDSLPRLPVVKFPEGTVNVTFGGSVGATLTFGLGGATKELEASLFNAAFSGSIGTDVGYHMTTDVFKPNRYTLGLNSKLSATVKFINLKFWGIDFSLMKDTWTIMDFNESLPLLETMMPNIYYSIPNGGKPGEIELRTEMKTINTRQEIISRDWFLDLKNIRTVGQYEDPTTRVQLNHIGSNMTVWGKVRDWFSGEVILRHSLASFEDVDTGINLMPSATKAKKRKIVVFCEDGVTYPDDSEDSDMPQSCDPNEIVGPKGVGEKRKVKPGTWMTYTVYFENKAEATGAAQEVKITHNLDEALDWSTFELIDVAYRNQVERGLAGKASGTATSELAGTAYKVRTEATLDATTGQAYWYLRIVDESTPDKWPADVYAGILPPNNDAHEGEGHVTYRVKVRDDAADGARIDSTATIVFDTNDPIGTDPAWWNTVAHRIELQGAVIELTTGQEGYAFEPEFAPLLENAAAIGLPLGMMWDAKACVIKGWTARPGTYPVTFIKGESKTSITLVIKARELEAVALCTEPIAVYRSEKTLVKGISDTIEVHYKDDPTMILPPEQWRLVARSLPQGLRMTYDTIYREYDLSGTTSAAEGWYPVDLTVTDKAFGGTVTLDEAVTVDVATAPLTEGTYCAYAMIDGVAYEIVISRPKGVAGTATVRRYGETRTLQFVGSETTPDGYTAIYKNGVLVVRLMQDEYGELNISVIEDDQTLIEGLPAERRETLPADSPYLMPQQVVFTLTPAMEPLVSGTATARIKANGTATVTVALDGGVSFTCTGGLFTDADGRYCIKAYGIARAIEVPGFILSAPLQ